jgi:hypothetical protein
MQQPREPALSPEATVVRGAPFWRGALRPAGVGQQGVRTLRLPRNLGGLTVSVLEHRSGDRGPKPRPRRDGALWRRGSEHVERKGGTAGRTQGARWDGRSGVGASRSTGEAGESHPETRWREGDARAGNRRGER